MQAGFGQRRAWLWLVGTLVLLAVMYLGTVDPSTSLVTVAWAAIHTGIVGNTMCATSPTKFSSVQRTSSGAHQNVPSETTGLR